MTIIWEFSQYSRLTKNIFRFYTFRQDPMSYRVGLLGKEREETRKQCRGSGSDGSGLFGSPESGSLVQKQTPVSIFFSLHNTV